MKTKIECEATLSVEVPYNFSADIVTERGGHGNDVVRRKLFFRSYRQSSEYNAEKIIKEVIKKLNEAIE